MAIKDFEYKTPEELATPDLPLEVQGATTSNAIVPNPQFIPQEQAIEEVNKPGFFRTSYHTWKELNEFTEAGAFSSRTVAEANPEFDEDSEGFNPYHEDNLSTVDPKYWPYILDSKSPKDMAFRKNYVHDQMAEDKEFENGSLLGKIIGGVAAAATSPSSFIPMLAMVKYGKVGAGIIQNAARITPGLLAGNIAHNAFAQGTDAGGNMSKFVENSFRDQIYGTALIVGGGAFLGPAMRALQLQNVKRVFNETADGVLFEMGLGSKGEHTGFVATSAPGFNLSAAKLDAAQDFADSTFAKSGLFAIPYSEKVLGIVNPVVRMQTSAFETTRYYADRMASKSYRTEGLNAGKAQLPTAEDMLQMTKNQQKLFDMQYRRAFYEANGIDQGLQGIQAIQHLRKRLDDAVVMDWDEFGKQIRNVIYSGTQHDSSQVNEQAAVIRKYVDGIYKRFNIAHDLSEEILPIRTAVEYLMRNYNIDEMVARPGEWDTVVSAGLKTQDAEIERLTSPLNRLEHEIKMISELKLEGLADSGELATQLKNARLQLRNAKLTLENELSDNPDLAILLEDRIYLNSKEAAELTKLTSPRDIASKAMDKSKDKIYALKKQLSAKRTQALNVKDADLQQLHVGKLQELELKVAEQEARLKEYEAEHFAEENKLHEAAYTGQINRKFFTKNLESGEIKFRDPNEGPKFRDVYKDDDARIAAAQAWHSTILNNTPEQINNHVLGSMMPSTFANPIKKRSIMLPDTLFNNSNFLDNDLPKNIANYANLLNKRSILKELFQSDLGEDGPHFIGQQMKENHDRLKDAINKKDSTEKEKQKARKVLQVKFDNARSDMQAMHQTFLGTRMMDKQTKNLSNFSRGVRSVAVVKLLGSVPIAQLTDMFANILKHGPWATMVDGFIPMLRSANGMMKGEHAALYKANASQLGLSLEHLIGGYEAKLYGTDAANYVALGGATGAVLKGTDKLAQLSGNAFGTNYIENFNQRLTANIVQGKIMRSMFKYKKGTLSKKELDHMLLYGLDPKVHADSFIKNYTEAGGHHNGTGGYQSLYYQWADDSANVAMSQAIHRAVNDTIIRKGMFDTPWWFSDPLAGLVTQFMGWSFAAFNRYTVPTMQRLEANKILGIMAMFAAGTWIDPLRRLSRGEDLDYGEKSMEKFFFAGFNNSGVAGYLLEGTQALDSMAGTNFLKSIQNDKFKGRDSGLAGFGPAGSIASDALKFVSMVATNNWNENDLKKGLKFIPFSQAWYLKALTAKFAESQNLPKNREVR